MNNSDNDPYGKSEGFDQTPHGSPPPGYQPQGYPPPGCQQPAYPPSAGPRSGYGQYPLQHLPMQAYGPYVPARPQKDGYPLS